MSKDYTNEIGYESLLADFKRYQKDTPRGVGMVRKGKNIYLQFKTPNTARKPYACGCTFTLDGMVEALSKSNKVAEALKILTSEAEFWQWYDKEIKEDSQLVNDRITFGEAIKKVEDDFWSRPDKRKNKRDKNNPSSRESWNVTYGNYYKRLPSDKNVDLKIIEQVLANWKVGTKTYGEAVSAMRKLVRMIKYKNILLALEDLDTIQTEFLELQTIDLKQFLAWREKTLGITTKLHPNARLDVRKSWMWVFSAQIVYALRISEVFAIKNLFEPYKAKDGVTIPALNDPSNTGNLIYIGEKTAIGTTVKTGSRIARPNIPPKYANLMETLNIKKPLLPTNKPTSKNESTLSKFYSKEARKKLLKWNAPYTQTHADRHLGNINGMQAGISLEVRAMSLGHTPAMNDSGYKKRIGTQTKIDLLTNSNSNAIDFVTALAEAKKLVAKDESKREFTAQLLSIIYQKNQSDITELL